MSFAAPMRRIRSCNTHAGAITFVLPAALLPKTQAALAILKLIAGPPMTRTGKRPRCGPWRNERSVFRPALIPVGGHPEWSASTSLASASVNPTAAAEQPDKVLPPACTSCT